MTFASPLSCRPNAVARAPMSSALLNMSVSTISGTGAAAARAGAAAAASAHSASAHARATNRLLPCMLDQREVIARSFAMASMDHLDLVVRSLERSLAFYGALPRPLGWTQESDRR